jgi:hypothetical protein
MFMGHETITEFRFVADVIASGSANPISVAENESQVPALLSELKQCAVPRMSTERIKVRIIREP